jgi:MscS family membrane protein
VDEGPQKYEYLFSTGTVDRAVEYFKRVESHPYRTDGPPVSEGLYDWFISAPGHPTVAAIIGLLPERMQRGRTLGLATWKWPGLILALAIGIGLMAVAYWLQITITNRVRGKSVFKYCLTIVFPIVAMLIPIGFKYVADRYVTIRGTPLYYISFFANLTVVLAALVVLFAATSRIAETIIASPRINPQGLNAQLIRIVSQLTALVASVIVFLAGGQYLGFQLTTLLASAGVGGVALALGAQDSLKTLFGTLMLMADKPFRVGERILFEKYDGVVEDIGLRSTKIRLLTGHQATLPNDRLARSDIENIGRRPHIRRITDFHIPLDTPCEKVEKAVSIARRMLDNHEGMDPEFPPRVFFNEINSKSFNVRMIYWYSPPNYWDFLAQSETLNVAICRAFEEHGIRFSLPSRVAHTSIDSRERPIQVKVVEDRAEPWQGQDDPLDEM